MKASSRTAMALAVGYVLGRRRKLRAALVLAGVAASGRAGSLGGAAIKRGMGLAGSGGVLGKLTPQFGGIADKVRDELLSAGRTAAVAVVNDRIESLSDSLHQRTESIRGLATDTGGSGGRQADESYEDHEDADYYEDDEPEGSYEDDAEGEPADAYEEEPEDSRQDEGEGRSVRSLDDEDEYEDRQLDDSLDNDVEEEQVNGSRRTRRSRSPVSRSGR